LFFDNTNTRPLIYISGIQYDNGSISFIQTAEGRAILSGGSYNYEYNLNDHLGNTRLSFDSHTGTATTVQQDDYYPFGLEINRSTTSPKNEYLYNKKELQEETGVYDYGARFYDPVIGRWTSVDPLAEKIAGITPYNFSFNNPLRYIDPDGLIPLELFDQHSARTHTGSFIYYTVKTPVAGFIYGALGISRQTITNTIWRTGGNAAYHAWTNSGTDAITMGHTVDVRNTNYANNDIGSWTSLIGHENTHRSEIDANGSLSFYGNYLHDAATMNYEDIPTEQRAFANGDQIDAFFANNKNRSDFNSILGNNSLSDEKKGNQLEALGIERIALPGLEKLGASLDSSLNSLDGSQETSDLTNAVQQLRDKVNQSVKDDKKRINDLRQ